MTINRTQNDGYITYQGGLSQKWSFTYHLSSLDVDFYTCHIHLYSGRHIDIEHRNIYSQFTERYTISKPYRSVEEYFKINDIPDKNDIQTINAVLNLIETSYPEDLWAQKIGYVEMPLDIV